MYGLVETMRDRMRKAGILEGDGRPEGPIRAVTGYGHMGDGKYIYALHLRRLTETGNIHINIVANKYSDEIEKVIEPFIYQAVGEFLVLPFGLADIPQPITMARSPLNTVLVSSVKGNCRLSLNLR